MVKERFVSEQVGVEQLKQRCAAGVSMQLVDVRSISEYGTGHIPGALNIPLEQIESRLGDLGSDPIVLICKSASGRAWRRVGWSFVAKT